MAVSIYRKQTRTGKFIINRHLGTDLQHYLQIYNRSFCKQREYKSNLLESFVSPLGLITFVWPSVHKRMPLLNLDILLQYIFIFYERDKTRKLTTNFQLPTHTIRAISSTEKTQSVVEKLHIGCFVFKVKLLANVTFDLYVSAFPIQLWLIRIIMLEL